MGSFRSIETASHSQRCSGQHMCGHKRFSYVKNSRPGHIGREKKFVLVRQNLYFHSRKRHGCCNHPQAKVKPTKKVNNNFISAIPQVVPAINV